MAGRYVVKLFTGEEATQPVWQLASVEHGALVLRGLTECAATGPLAMFAPNEWRWCGWVDGLAAEENSDGD